MVAGNVALASAHDRAVAAPGRLRRPRGRRPGEPAALRRLPEAGRAGDPFVAFGSHVDTEALAAAGAAGCDPVLPRSKFSAELPDLIRRYFRTDSPAG